MESECNTIRYLKRLSAPDASVDQGVGAIAASTLKIIEDARESSMTNQDLDYLHILVDCICLEGHEILAAHLRDGVPDCDICAALVKHMESPLPPADQGA